MRSAEARSPLKDVAAPSEIAVAPPRRRQGKIGAVELGDGRRPLQHPAVRGIAGGWHWLPGARLQQAGAREAPGRQKQYEQHFFVSEITSLN